MNKTEILKSLDKMQVMVNELIDLYEAADDYIEESPCDPDITPKQTAAWIEYKGLKKQFKEKYPNT